MQSSEYACRKCGTFLFRVDDATHGVDGSERGSAGKAKAKWARHARRDAHCTSIFVGEPPAWCEDKVGSNSDALYCPNSKCGARVGNYSWSGAACSCGQWIAPAFQFQLAKIDGKAQLDLASLTRGSSAACTQAATRQEVSGKV